MRYHAFKESVYRNFPIALSQAMYLDYANFNVSPYLELIYTTLTFRFMITSFPYYSSLHRKKDLFNGRLLSEVSAEEISNKIGNLANVLKYRAEKCFFFQRNHP